MTALDDTNIIENEFCGTAKLTDGIRIEYTHTHTQQLAVENRVQQSATK